MIAKIPWLLLAAALTYTSCKKASNEMPPVEVPATFSYLTTSLNGKIIDAEFSRITYNSGEDSLWLILRSRNPDDVFENVKVAVEARLKTTNNFEGFTQTVATFTLDSVSHTGSKKIPIAYGHYSRNIDSLLNVFVIGCKGFDNPFSGIYYNQEVTLAKDSQTVAYPQFLGYVAADGFCHFRFSEFTTKDIIAVGYFHADSTFERGRIFADKSIVSYITSTDSLTLSDNALSLRWKLSKNVNDSINQINIKAGKKN